MIFLPFITQLPFVIGLHKVLCQSHIRHSYVNFVPNWTGPPLSSCVHSAAPSANLDIRQLWELDQYQEGCNKGCHGIPQVVFNKQLQIIAVCAVSELNTGEEEWEEAFGTIPCLNYTIFQGQCCYPAYGLFYPAWYSTHFKTEKVKLNLHNKKNDPIQYSWDLMAILGGKNGPEFILKYLKHLYCNLAIELGKITSSWFHRGTEINPMIDITLFTRTKKLVIQS